MYVFGEEIFGHRKRRERMMFVVVYVVSQLKGTVLGRRRACCKVAEGEADGVLLEEG